MSGAITTPAGCQCKACSVTPHGSDCAVHNEPALPAGPCDCRAPIPRNSFRPLQQYILVRPDPLSEMIGSIVVPDPNRAHHQGDGVLTSGTVVAVGPGDLILKGARRGDYAPVGCRPGDRVLYPRHELVPVLEDGLHVIHEQHLFGVLEAT